MITGCLDCCNAAAMFLAFCSTSSVKFGTCPKEGLIWWAIAKPNRAISSGAPWKTEELISSSGDEATVKFARNPFSSCTNSLTAASCQEGNGACCIACTAAVFITAWRTANAITGAVFQISSPKINIASACSISWSEAVGTMPEHKISTTRFSK